MRHSLASSLELLESRIAPAVLLQTGDFDGDGSATDLRLTGGSGKERILITDSSTATIVSIDNNGDGDFTDAGERNAVPLGFGARQIEISMGGGNDNVTISLAPSGYGSAKAIFVNLGGGNNEFHFLANGQTIGTGPFRLDVTGGAQNDYVELDFDRFLVNAEINLRLGKGVDGKLTGGKITGPSEVRFNDLVGGPINADFDLGPGSNRFQVLGNGITGGSIDLYTPMNLRITGSNVATDKDNVTMSFVGARFDTGSDIQITALLGAGNDLFRTTIEGLFGLFSSSGSIDRNANLIIDVDGGAGNDVLEVVRTGTPGNLTLDGILDLRRRHLAALRCSERSVDLVASSCRTSKA